MFPYKTRKMFCIPPATTTIPKTMQILIQCRMDPYSAQHSSCVSVLTAKCCTTPHMLVRRKIQPGDPRDHRLPLLAVTNKQLRLLPPSRCPMLRGEGKAAAATGLTVGVRLRPDPQDPSHLLLHLVSARRWHCLPHSNSSSKLSYIDRAA